MSFQNVPSRSQNFVSTSSLQLSLFRIVVLFTFLVVAFKSDLSAAPGETKKGSPTDSAVTDAGSVASVVPAKPKKKVIKKHKAKSSESSSLADSSKSATPSTSSNTLLEGDACPLPETGPQLFICSEVDGKWKFDGLTEAGMQVIRDARAILIQRNSLFEDKFKQLTAVHHAAMVARLMRGNMFLYGPPGGAKSDVVNWIFKGEPKGTTFKLQLHQLVSTQPFTGGQDFEAAKKGEWKIRTKGSMIHSKVLLWDEIDKANPATLACSFNLLNEREVYLGDHTIEADTQTVFVTGNANLPEIVQQFENNNQGTSAPALLNRFHFKAFVYNYLSKDSDQEELDDRLQESWFLGAVKTYYPEAGNKLIFENPKPVDWDSLNLIAKVMFRFSKEFGYGYRAFAREMRNATYAEVNRSELAHKNDPVGTPFAYFPSAEIVERLRLRIPEVILYSAFLDFLYSPLADETNLPTFAKETTYLDPLSIWRASLVLTTLGPGKMAQEWQLTEGSKLPKMRVNFGWDSSNIQVRDKREELMIENLKAEQNRFNDHFTKMAGVIQKCIEDNAPWALQDPKAPKIPKEKSISFELRLKLGR